MMMMIQEQPPKPLHILNTPPFVYSTSYETDAKVCRGSIKNSVHKLFITGPIDIFGYCAIIISGESQRKSKTKKGMK